jgi:hypothetical protein
MVNIMFKLNPILLPEVIAKRYNFIDDSDDDDLFTYSTVSTPSQEPISTATSVIGSSVGGSSEFLMVGWFLLNS